MLAALERGVPRGRAQEAAAGACAKAQRGMAGISEAEKAFTSQARMHPPSACAQDACSLVVPYSSPPAGRASPPLQARAAACMATQWCSGHACA